MHIVEPVPAPVSSAIFRVEGGCNRDVQTVSWTGDRLRER